MSVLQLSENIVRSISAGTMQNKLCRKYKIIQVQYYIQCWPTSKEITFKNLWGMLHNFHKIEYSL